MAGLAKKVNKPRLQNIDDMLGIGDATTEISAVSKNIIASVEIGKLTPFRNHPFRLYDGEQLEDMVASIVSNGVLVPIIVRKVDDILEILAGHNRANAAELAGLNEVPTIILEGISDEDAMAYIIETNLLQRSFSDMAHTEKAAVIALHHSKMFSQGKRSDILLQIEMLDKPHKHKDYETCAQVGHKLKSRDIVANEYNLSRNTVARYLRIAQLSPALKARLDNNDFAFMTAVTLSYLKSKEQELLNEYMEHNALTVDMKKADMLRKLSEEGKLNKESIYEVLSGKTKPKANSAPTVKLSKTLYSKYFKPNQPVKEIQNIIEKALELYFANRKEPSLIQNS